MDNSNTPNPNDKTQQPKQGDKPNTQPEQSRKTDGANLINLTRSSDHDGGNHDGQSNAGRRQSDMNFARQIWSQQDRRVAQSTQAFVPQFELFDKSQAVSQTYDAGPNRSGINPTTDGPRRTAPGADSQRTVVGNGNLVATARAAAQGQRVEQLTNVAARLQTLRANREAQRGQNGTDKTSARTDKPAGKVQDLNLRMPLVRPDSAAQSHDAQIDAQTPGENASTESKQQTPDDATQVTPGKQSESVVQSQVREQQNNTAKSKDTQQLAQGIKIKTGESAGSSLSSLTSSNPQPTQTTTSQDETIDGGSILAAQQARSESIIRRAAPPKSGEITVANQVIAPTVNTGEITIANPVVTGPAPSNFGEITMPVAPVAPAAGEITVASPMIQAAATPEVVLPSAVGSSIISSAPTAYANLEPISAVSPQSTIASPLLANLESPPVSPTSNIPPLGAEVATVPVAGNAVLASSATAGESALSSKLDATAPAAVVDTKAATTGYVPSLWLPPREQSSATATDAAGSTANAKLAADATAAPAKVTDTTTGADGSTTTKYSDGEVMVRNKQGQLTQVTDAEGRVNSFTYAAGSDGKSQLSGVTNSNGTWNKQGDGWVNAQGQVFNGTIAVDTPPGSGVFSFKDNSSGVTNTWSPDGTHTSQYADGLNVTFDKTGVATQAVDASGKQLALSSDNSSSAAKGSFSFTDATGNSVTVNADSTRTVKEPGGATMTTDAQGRPTEMVSADGKTTLQYEYDAKTGAVASMENQYGWWQKQSDGSWKSLGDANQAPMQGTLAVNADGGYTFTNTQQPGQSYAEVQTVRADGSQTVRQTDGSIVTQNKDGSSVTSQMFGGQPEVTNIKTADNQTYAFTYDGQGHMTGMTNAQGNWTTTDGQNWTSTGTPPQTWQGTVKVDGQGNYSYSDKGSDTTATVHADGSITMAKVGATGSDQIVRDANGNITSTTDSAGDVQKFGYDSKTGQLNSVTIDGTTLNSSDGGKTWSSGDVTKTGQMALDQKSGVLSFTDSTGDKETYNLDGTKTLAQSDGSTLQINAQNHITSVTDGRGATYSYGYDANNNITSVSMPDGTKLSRTDASQPFTDGKGNQYNNLALDSTGNLTYSQVGSDASGKQSTIATISHNSDGSYMNVNAAGQVAATTDAAGRTAQYTYSASGKLIEANTSNNGDWKSTDGGVRFTNGAGLTSKDLAIESDGTLRFTDQTGQFTSTSMDGGTQLRKPDGTLQTLDKNGNTTQLVDTSGNVYQFTYDKSIPGGISSVYNSYGLWTTTDGTNWSNLDPTTGQAIKNADGTAKTWQGSVQVKDGVYSYTSANGDRTTPILGTDNTQVKTDKGTSYIMNGSNQILSAKDAAGQSYQYTYDSTGKLTGIAVSKDATNFSPVDMSKYTSATIGKDGLAQMTDSTGAVTKFHTDGSLVTTTSDGKISQSVDLNGNTTKYNYDAKTGDLASFTTGNTTWTKATDANGNEVWNTSSGQQFKGAISLDASGNQSWQSRDLTVSKTVHADGTSTELHLSGSNAYGSIVQKDANGHITSVTDSQGNTNSFSNYGANGQPGTMSDGKSTWTKSTDASGNTVWKSNQPGAQPFTGNLTLDGQGNQVWTNTQDGTSRTVFNDGKQLLQNKDGSGTLLSADGATTTYIHKPDSTGNSVQVEVHQNGNIKITNTDGSVLRQQNGAVTLTGPDGKPYNVNGQVVDTSKISVSVDGKGDVLFNDANTQKSASYNMDGTVTNLTSSTKQTPTAAIPTNGQAGDLLTSNRGSTNRYYNPTTFTPQLPRAGATQANDGDNRSSTGASVYTGDRQNSAPPVSNAFGASTDAKTVSLADKIQQSQNIVTSSMQGGLTVESHRETPTTSDSFTAGFGGPGSTMQQTDLHEQSQQLNYQSKLDSQLSQNAYASGDKSSGQLYQTKSQYETTQAQADNARIDADRASNMAQNARGTADQLKTQSDNLDTQVERAQNQVDQLKQKEQNIDAQLSNSDKLSDNQKTQLDGQLKGVQTDEKAADQKLADLQSKDSTATQRMEQAESNASQLNSKAYQADATATALQAKANTDASTLSSLQSQVAHEQSSATVAGTISGSTVVGGTNAIASGANLTGEGTVIHGATSTAGGNSVTIGSGTPGVAGAPATQASGTAAHGPATGLAAVTGSPSLEAPVASSPVAAAPGHSAVTTESPPAATHGATAITVAGTAGTETGTVATAAGHAPTEVAQPVTTATVGTVVAGAQGTTATETATTHPAAGAGTTPGATATTVAGAANQTGTATVVAGQTNPATGVTLAAPASGNPVGGPVVIGGTTQQAAGTVVTAANPTAAPVQTAPVLNAPPSAVPSSGTTSVAPVQQAPAQNNPVAVANAPTQSAPVASGSLQATPTVAPVATQSSPTQAAPAAPTQSVPAPTQSSPTQAAPAAPTQSAPAPTQSSPTQAAPAAPTQSAPVPTQSSPTTSTQSGSLQATPTAAPAPTSSSPSQSAPATPTQSAPIPTQATPAAPAQSAPAPTQSSPTQAAPAAPTQSAPVPTQSSPTTSSQSGSLQATPTAAPAPTSSSPSQSAPAAPTQPVATSTAQPAPTPSAPLNPAPGTTVSQVPAQNSPSAPVPTPISSAPVIGTTVSQSPSTNQAPSSVPTQNSTPQPTSGSQSVSQPTSQPTNAAPTMPQPTSQPTNVGPAVPQPTAQPINVGPAMPQPTSQPTNVGPAVPQPTQQPTNVGPTLPQPTSQPTNVGPTLPQPTTQPTNVGPAVPQPTQQPTNVGPTLPQPTSQPTNVGPTLPQPTQQPTNVGPAMPQPTSQPTNVGPAMPQPTSQPTNVGPAMPPPTSQPTNVGPAMPQPTSQPTNVGPTMPQPTSQPTNVGPAMPQPTSQPTN
ncbi:MAG TPA: hypothetical protein V6C81_07210, partial [Planktothrix sp.]